MRITARLKKLEHTLPRCDGRITRIADAGEVLTEADRCRLCGGCHVLVVQEVIVETRQDVERRTDL